jgi:hypothetical protein
MDPAMRILALAVLDVVCQDAHRRGFLQVSVDAHGYSDEAVRPYFNSLSPFEKRACMVKAEQLARAA